MKRADGPLAGVTVLDLTQFLAGPYASQILGDLGARVIKIEPPAGDMTRGMPPYFFKGESAYFLGVNRNKESVVLDLKLEPGRALLLRLVKHAQIVLENFRPGVAARLGVDYEQIRAVNPAAVVCSLSGFGQDGPYRDLPAYDIVVQALSGGMSLTGEEQGKPVRSGIPLGDLAGGMFTVIGALAALAQATKTGEGKYVDVSLLDCQISMLSYQAAYHLIGGEIPGPQGRGHRSIPTYRAFTCADGIEIVVAATTEKMWRGLCEVLGLGALAADPRFVLNDARLGNRAALDALLEGAFARVRSEAVLAELARAEVPAAPINTVDRALADPQVRHRDMVVDLIDDDGDSVRVAGNPVKVSGYSSRQHTYPPGLGAHSRSVLRELLGATDDEMDRLEGQGVISSSGTKT